MQAPTEERFLMRKTELLNRITTLLGGRAAEQIVFSDVSTGAQNDLSRATEIARSMVESYGMSPRLGQVYLAPRHQMTYLNTGQPASSTTSAKTAEQIDAEIRRIIDEQYADALAIL
jgi:cell division protease FtsH